MNLFDQILNWDRQLFFNLNSHHSPWMDNFMWLVSDPIVWIPFFLVALYALFKNKKNNSIAILITIALLIVITDQLSSGVIKPLVARLRPTHDPEFCDWVNTVNNYKGGLYSFVSGHATNFFALALFTSLIFNYWPYTIVSMLWALLISFSRIYLGVHYPLDIFSGMLLGILMSVLFYYIYVRIFDSSSKIRKKENRYRKAQLSSGFVLKDLNLLIITLLLLIVSLLTVSYSLVW